MAILDQPAIHFHFDFRCTAIPCFFSHAFQLNVSVREFSPSVLQNPNLECRRRWEKDHGSEAKTAIHSEGRYVRVVVEGTAFCLAWCWRVRAPTSVLHAHSRVGELPLLALHTVNHLKPTLSRLRFHLTRQVRSGQVHPCMHAWM